LCEEGLRVERRIVVGQMGGVQGVFAGSEVSTVHVGDAVERCAISVNICGLLAECQNLRRKERRTNTSTVILIHV